MLEEFGNDTIMSTLHDKVVDLDAAMRPTARALEPFVVAIHDGIPTDVLKVFFDPGRSPAVFSRLCPPPRIQTAP